MVTVPTADELKSILSAHKKWVESGGAEGARANLYGANLRGAKLSDETVIETGETWKAYVGEVVPALLCAGGRPVAEIATPKTWECHSWTNCPMAEAFGADNLGDVPVLLRPRADQFIRYFDAGLIPMPGAKAQEA
ncbi:MAG: hypothetical protein QOE90_912 [Thermoplasmata archaeon]|nr:hypothetical protein [Thermoplasmata archaeon]